MTTCALGLDIGSTYLKALVVSADGESLHAERRPTPWHCVADGGTEMRAEDLVATVLDLLTAVDRVLGGSTRVTSIGVSGMAEAGVLLDADDRVARPVVAWFDPRGGDEVAALPAEVRADFPGRTGLPVSPLATFAKLLHHRAGGLDLRGLTWLNVPEYVAQVLGGDRVGELSLVARTGLIDQDTAKPWLAVLDALDADEALLPPIAAAGSVWGRASANLPPSMGGAVITVAGHDHLVASVAAGTLTTDQLYDSMGTAEALVRILDRPLDRDARASLATSGVNVVRHMLPRRSTMLAATRGGLVLRRVLQLLGIRDEQGRSRLDAAVMQLPDGGGKAAAPVTVFGASNLESALTIRSTGDDLSPAMLFAAALRHCTDELREVVALMDSQMAAATRTIVSGGWAQMDSVRRARGAALPGVSFSCRSEDTAFGAAMVGAFAADPDADDLTDFAVRYLRAEAPMTEADDR